MFSGYRLTDRDWILLTGWALTGTEAAHIHRKACGGPCVIHNGPALCSLHPGAFDTDSYYFFRMMNPVAGRTIHRPAS